MSQAELRRREELGVSARERAGSRKRLSGWWESAAGEEVRSRKACVWHKGSRGGSLVFAAVIAWFCAVGRLAPVPFHACVREKSERAQQRRRSSLSSLWAVTGNCRSDKSGARSIGSWTYLTSRSCPQTLHSFSGSVSWTEFFQVLFWANFFSSVITDTNWVSRSEQFNF